MLVVDSDKRLTIVQILKHRWLADAPPVEDIISEKDLQLNKTVIDHMLQLPNLNQNMIVQSLKSNSFDHIYAIYNLLLDKLHQKTINFQSKVLEQRRVDNQQRSEEQNISGKFFKIIAIGKYIFFYSWHMMTAFATEYLFIIFILCLSNY